MSFASAGTRPLLIGVGAGGIIGSLSAIPALQHDLGGSDLGGAMGKPVRRAAGVLANFVLPAALVIAAGRTSNSLALQSGLLSAAAAVAGAYWGTRLLGSE